MVGASVGRGKEPAIPGLWTLMTKPFIEIYGEQTIILITQVNTQ
jgi:hypothetical protein